MKVESTKVFQHLEHSTKRITVEQGGTRSGKTYNILMWIILSYCARNAGQGKIISIVRKTFPSLRGTAMRDFEEILHTCGLYSRTMHNKSSSEFVLFGNRVEFTSLDQPQKMRGRKRDLLFVNEANELTAEEFFQLNIRTSEKVILDYNPSMEFHWIYDKVLPREDAELFVTTYLDNPFLSDSMIKEIELLEVTDEDYWKVYGLGQRGRSRELIFQYNQIDRVPLGAILLGYGIDWGYANSPTALVQVWQDGNALILKEMLYQTGMQNPDMHRAMLDMGISKTDIIVADSEDPKSIDEMAGYGWNIHKSIKGIDSVIMGIDIMKRHELYATSDSLNIIKEFRNYKWKKDKDDKLINDPVKLFDHAMDAARYLIYFLLGHGLNYGKYHVM